MLETSWTTERILRLAVLAILIVACLRIVAPFIGALTWAGIIAITVWPAFLWLAARLGGRPRLAATLFTVALAVILVLPFAVLVVSLGDAVSQVAALLRDLTAVTVPEPPSWLIQIPGLGKVLDQAWRGAGCGVAGILDLLSRPDRATRRAGLVARRALVILPSPGRLGLVHADLGVGGCGGRGQLSKALPHQPRGQAPHRHHLHGGHRGGLLAWGMIGLFIGPTLLAVAFSLLRGTRRANVISKHKPVKMCMWRISSRVS